MWTYSYQIAGGILIVLSSVVSQEMPKEWRVRMWIGFIALALIYSTVGIHLAKQKQIAQRHRDGEIKELRQELDQNVLQQARMTGELTAMREVMGSLSKTGLPGFREFATAITNVMQTNARRTTEGPISDKQLCDRALKLAKSIRDFESTYENNERYASFQGWKPNQTPKQQQADWELQTRETIRRYQQHKDDFRNKFFEDGKYLKDLMLEKIPPEKRDALVKVNGQAESNLNFGQMTGAFNEYLIANYLEEISKTLCPVQH
jgi:hypothetical protein